MRGRLYRLDGWLIETLIPPARVGSYVLYRRRRPVYVGRSDRDLRGRLLSHRRDGRADYFSYAVHDTVQQAFDAECCQYHSLRGQLLNHLHPDRPDHLALRCSFCLSTIRRIRVARLARHAPSAAEGTTPVSAKRKDEQ